MRRDIIKDVEIKEPPLEEITRKYSTFSSIKRSCIGGCGCVVFLIIVILIVLKFIIGVGPQEIKAVPTDWPADIPVYDEDHAETITFVSGRYKNRIIEVAAFFPKIILSPLIAVLEQDHPTSQDSQPSSLTRVWRIINSPISDQRDVVKISWINLNAEPGFLYSYYNTELSKQGYVITAQSIQTEQKQFSFAKDNITGSFYVKASEDLVSTQQASLIVNYYPASTLQPVSSTNTGL
ncbi:MAG: hypothetical protein COU31_00520 [Candidatus Magasanikbacteria bacterium CG10_big_fil_rev_8_21_14_0_10_40_10]|uniref:Uncharacterized protein n=1 Tax=Candidatus Magasanikbacteria bacterium CG10_big_fil_rev_8_21_14_0_10_40_10 TaxID=1974648 RepID=A0A2M6W521_9BACT|nr:MAG: hypothetical protein COU31_00520 [Candidatus Magasanikbacteria bacterium CG10_big_fil_rev_8_21_14_0_10_40_10]